ncbi:MAG: DUF4838 domain-containing protein [Lentisphaeria bacterium]|nr:DUF4838 domain-containing protein [Lentisphaeria bacterium]
MKKLLPSLLLLAAVFSLSAWEFRDYPPPRKTVISAQKTPVNYIEVVMPEKTRLLEFAAKELCTYLGKVTGKKIPLLSAPSGKGISIVIGDNALARKAGINAAKAYTDGYFIRRIGNTVYIAGVDSTTLYPARNIWCMWFPRGTISGVYDFLDRFAGVRFYFPGEMGTVAEKIPNFALPAKIDIEERPDFQIRYSSQYTNSKRWYENNNNWKYDGVTGQNLQWLRNRFSTFNIPPAHGLANLRYGDRYKNPEYFALMPDGKRYNNPSLQHSPHLCFSSGIVEEIYQDVKAYLTGKSPKVRGINRKRWDVNVASHNCVSVMPHDWFYMCCCEKCKKLVPKGARTYQGDQKSYEQIAELIFGLTAKIGNRLKKEGIPGYITQMSYTPYYMVPKVKLPDNVLVMTAVMGPWSRDNREDDALLAGWNKKLNHRTWIWTYSYKYSSKYKEEALPEMCPRAAGKFYKDRSKWIFGGYHAGPSEDSFIYTYLNIYTVAKVFWDNSTDVDKLLAEHHQKMFGPKAAPHMARFYDLLEKCWLKVVGEKIDTPLGPITRRATEDDVWNKIYTAKVISEMESCFVKAEKLASGDAKKRVLFIRKNLFEQLKLARTNYCDSTVAYERWRSSVPGRIILKHCTKEETAVKTAVDLSQDAEHLIVKFTCDEPAMKENRSVKRERDGKLWHDSCVETMLCSDPLRKKYYHFIVNTDGSFYDSEVVTAANGLRQENAKWNSSARVKVSRSADRWTAELVIPKKEIGAAGAKSITANFGRSRLLKSMKPGTSDHSMWTPFIDPSGFHNIKKFGRLDLVAVPETNLLKNSSFTKSQRNFKNRPADWSFWCSGGLKGGQKVALDDKIFVSDGKSLHFSNVANGKISAGYKLTGKADTTYRLSFYMKTRNVVQPAPARGGAGAYIHAGKLQFGRPSIRITGTTPWRYHEYTFKTGKTPDPRIIIGLWNWECAGDVWFDDVKLEEVKK